MTMRLAYYVLVLLALWLPAGSSALAQDLTPDRVQLELDRTDERIAQAEMVVSSSDNETARQELEAAIEIQARAKIEFRSLHLRIAMDLTLRSRGRASRAISIVRGLPDPDRVLSQLERTREVIERARDRIEECGDDRAHAMLRAALEMQARAETAFRNDRFLAALQLSSSARERAMRALRICRVQENLQESAERALRRTDEVLARARDRVSDRPSEAARRALGRAFEMQERAQVEFRADHFEASLRLTQTARAFAYRSIRLSGGGS